MAVPGGGGGLRHALLVRSVLDRRRPPGERAALLEAVGWLGRPLDVGDRYVLWVAARKHGGALREAVERLLASHGLVGGPAVTAAAEGAACGPG